MISKYMIDSSVWISYFGDQNYSMTPIIRELIEKDQVYINGIIQTELLKGAKSEKQYRALKNNLNGLRFLEISRNLFDRISNAAYVLRGKGVTVPLTDLIIAIHCVEEKIILIEEDKHFSYIQGHFNLERYRARIDDSALL